MSQEQVRITGRQNTTTKFFRLKYRYYVTTGNKIGVILRKKDDDEQMAALLNLQRIKKVMFVAVPSKPQGSERVAVVVTKDKVFIQYFTKDMEEKLRSKYPDATIYLDHELATYIAYETSNDYYKPAQLDNIDGIVVKEGSLELLEEEKMIQSCGRYGWRVWLYEIGRWDKYCFDLVTAFEILMTGIHPVYGVMD